MPIAPLCAFYAEDSSFVHKELAQFTFLGLRNLFLIFRSSLFFVNCAFLAVTDYAIAAKCSLLVWEVSLLRERQCGAAPLTPASL